MEIGKSKKNKVILRILLALILFAALFAFIYWRVRPYPIVNRNDWRSVHTVFEQALIKNDEAIAKSLTAPEQWEHIDRWMVSREPFDCPFVWKTDNELSYLFTTSNENGTISITYLYECIERQYSFNADYSLQETASGWKVVKLYDICEQYTWNSDLCHHRSAK